MKKFHSVQKKLIYILGLVAFLSIFLSSVAIFSHTVYMKTNDGIERISQLSDIASVNLIASVEFEDNESADEVLKTFEMYDSIEGAFVTISGNIFSSYIRFTEKRELLQEMVLFELEPYEHHHINFNYIRIVKPISLENETLGYLIIIGNTKKLFSTIVEQFLVQFLVSIVIFIIVILLSFKLQKRVSEPILKLRDMMEMVSLQDNYSLRVYHKDNDEIRLLYNGFNNMLEQIRNKTEELQEAKKEIEALHKRTESSIEYASYIQHSIVPDTSEIAKSFPSYFVIWKPKDIVGGDIYFFEEIGENESLLFVIDCTGHGVPGAFVTMLVKAIQKQVISDIVKSSETVSPSKILNYFNSEIKRILKQGESTNNISNVGFEGVVLYINRNKIRFAGASTPVFLLYENKLEMFKTDRYSIGYKKSREDFQFKELEVSIAKGMRLYISTDGLFDQKGGSKGFGFGKKRFKETILNSGGVNMKEQKEILENRLAKYKEEYYQIDDITVLGLEF
jgi:serine phosphatase RsbU (regulator of sigma subunit)